MTGLRERYERLRLWLAGVLYLWSCRLARKRLRSPWTAALDEMEIDRLTAECTAALAEIRRSQTRCDELLVLMAADRPPRVVVF